MIAFRLRAERAFELKKHFLYRERRWQRPPSDIVDARQSKIMVWIIGPTVYAARKIGTRWAKELNKTLCIGRAL